MNQARERAVHATLEALGLIDAAAGARVIAAVAGGINKTARVEIRDRMLFAKWNDRGLRAHFSAEAAGLEALRAADSGLRVPTVIAHRDEPATEAFLLLEHIENVNRPAEFDETLGRGLARLHRTSSRQGFGFACDTYCGATRQINAWYTDWIDFFRDERLAAQVQLARHRGMSRVDAALCDRLLARLDEWIADDEPPALLHGDLWSGNLLCDAAGVLKGCESTPRFEGLIHGRTHKVPTAAPRSRSDRRLDRRIHRLFASFNAVHQCLLNGAATAVASDTWCGIYHVRESSLDATTLGRSRSVEEQRATGLQLRERVLEAAGRQIVGDVVERRRRIDEVERARRQRLAQECGARRFDAAQLQRRLTALLREALFDVVQTRLVPVDDDGVHRPPLGAEPREELEQLGSRPGVQRRDAEHRTVLSRTEAPHQLTPEHDASRPQRR
jgi:fructosamine-3-kinase